MFDDRNVIVLPLRVDLMTPLGGRGRPDTDITDNARLHDSLGSHLPGGLQHPVRDGVWMSDTVKPRNA